MATAVFQGVSSDWDDTSNWSGGAGAGGVPANSDTVVIAQSAQDLDTNLTTGLTGIILRIGPGYSGTIGGSANYLDIDGTVFDFDGRGVGCFVTGVWTTVTVKGGSAGANMMNLRANASTDIGTLKVYGGNGTVTVGQNAVLDDLEVVNATGVIVLVDENVTSLDTVLVDSGDVTVKSNMASTVTANGGVLTVDSTATIATLDVNPDATVLHKSSGTITTLNVYGAFDGRDNNNASVTVSNCTGYEGGTIELRNGLSNYTFTNNIINYGVIVRPPLGASLSWT